MPYLYRNLTRHFIFKAIIFCVALLCVHSLLFAETYSVPQTAEVTLAWDANDPVPDGYHVYQRSEGQAYDYTQPIRTTSNTTTTIYNLAYDTTYHYVVRAYVGNDVSGDSNEVSFTSSSSTGSSAYTITAAVSGSGVISPSGAVTVTEGDDQTFVISSNTGSYLVDVTVDGTSMGALSAYTFTQVSGNHTISAEFAYFPHTISASSGSYGTISPSGDATVDHGADQNYLIMPDPGYHVQDVVVDGISVGALTTYLFDQVSQDHTIHVTFTPDQHNLSASAGNGGTITPSGVVTVDHGADQYYVITPDPGYHVQDVVVDGTSMGLLTTYLFDQVSQDHTIHVTFAPDRYTITASADSGGMIAPSGDATVDHGADQNYIITPAPGYHVNDVLVDGTSMGALTTYTFSNIDSDHTITALFVLDNQPPAADAGPDQTVDEGQIVTLSGLNSIDPDDGIAAFQWRQIQGVAVSLGTPTEPQTTFYAPDVDDSGTALVFELMVTDYSGATSVDRCIVNVTWINMPPIADAGADQTVKEGDQVVLDASGSMDPDDGIASYTWKQLLGPVVTLSDPNFATPAFVAPNVATQGTSMTFEVTVTDTGGLQNTSTCVINVTWVNTPPVADAGFDQEAAIGAEVQLDGSQSHDADDLTIAAFKWHQTHGAPVALSDATASRPVFVVPAGAYEITPLIFELTVTDSSGLQATDSCHVNVIPDAPAGPVLYISRIVMTLDQKGPNNQAHALVMIRDGDGNIIKQANVMGTWYLNGNAINTVSTATRGDGSAKLDSDKLIVEPGGIFSVEITSVVQDGYYYDPALNIATSQSISVP